MGSLVDSALCGCSHQLTFPSVADAITMTPSPGFPSTGRQVAQAIHVHASPLSQGATPLISTTWSITSPWHPGQVSCSLNCPPRCGAFIFCLEMVIFSVETSGQPLTVLPHGVFLPVRHNISTALWMSMPPILRTPAATPVSLKES